MKRHTIVGVVLAALLVSAGVAAAAPGDSPAAAQSHANDAHARGPPGDLPGPVPDFVSAIHDAVNDFLDGVLDGPLGATVSDHAGTDHAGDAGATNESA